MLTREMKLIGVRERIKKMIATGWLSTCDIDICCELLGVTIGRESYVFLRAFHCVKFADIPKDALEVIRHILEDAFSQDVFEIQVGIVNEPVVESSRVVANVTSEPKPKRTILRLLGGG